MDIYSARSSKSAFIFCDTHFVYASEGSGPVPSDFKMVRTVTAAEIECNGKRKVFYSRKEFGAMTAAVWHAQKPGDHYACKVVEPRFSPSFLSSCQKT